MKYSSKHSLGVWDLEVNEWLQPIEMRQFMFAVFTESNALSLHSLAGWVWWYLHVFQASGRLRQEDQKIKVIFPYTVRLRPAWTIWDPASNKQTKTKITKQNRNLHYFTLNVKLVFKLFLNLDSLYVIKVSYYKVRVLLHSSGRSGAPCIAQGGFKLGNFLVLFIVHHYRM